MREVHKSLLRILVSYFSSYQVSLSSYIYSFKTRNSAIDVVSLEPNNGTVSEHQEGILDLSFCFKYFCGLFHCIYSSSVLVDLLISGRHI